MLKSMYPKSYMFSKINHLISEKEGQSVFEQYLGISEVTTSKNLKKDTRYAATARIYNLSEI